jgi:hypothetical protein
LPRRFKRYQTSGVPSAVILEADGCKWKKKVAAFGRNTGRILLNIALFVVLPIANSEEILAVIPN